MARFFFAIWYWPIFFVLTILAGFVCLIVSLFSKKATRYISSHVWAAIVLTPAAIKIKVEGQENLPAKGGFIIFANHRSLLDIPTVAKATGRSISWVAKAALGQIPVFGWVLKRVHMLVDRGGGADAAKKMLIEASARLAAGEVMAIFPEGTRNKSEIPILPLKKGAFILAKHTGVPLVPLTIYNSGALWPTGSYLPHSGQIKAHIGPPLEIEPRESLANITEKASQTLTDLYLGLQKELPEKTNSPDI
ncbi:MAG: 1-acyl-sn-glycerol-3-phosphate acyltransferase [Deltaproteobacteria bacterium]|jgi:1-acyl-sn-glycerol-3-phosphate acyltransferase|nr:1-acyl-sn-glycerol-3-phosphate acyltransferase [Deltaproteobacteria bacterium]